MDEKQLEKAMNLIGYSGNAKSLAIQALNAAEKDDFAKADELLTEAKKELHQAHEIQTKWMSSEMNGEKVEKTILLIHSQDHFMAADTVLLLAQKMIALQKKNAKLEVK